MGSVNVQGYLDSVNAPWGRLFYRLVWHNIECRGKRILDFGSGFGITANHFAAENDVVAVEPGEHMLEHRRCGNDYRQLCGDVGCLSELESGTFDMIICHNVLEYAQERNAIFSEFERLLAPDGVISIVKHNRAGKVMQKAVFENKIDEALALLSCEQAHSVNFGEVHEYSTSDIADFCGGSFVVDRVFGVRMFFALQRNELKTADGWEDELFRLEIAAQEIPEYRDIAFFHHLLLTRA